MSFLDVCPSVRKNSLLVANLIYHIYHRRRRHIMPFPRQSGLCNRNGPKFLSRQGLSIRKTLPLQQQHTHLCTYTSMLIVFEDIPPGRVFFGQCHYMLSCTLFMYSLNIVSTSYMQLLVFLLLLRNLMLFIHFDSFPK